MGEEVADGNGGCVFDVLLGVNIPKLSATMANAAMLNAKLNATKA